MGKIYIGMMLVYGGMYLGGCSGASNPDIANLHTMPYQLKINPAVLSKWRFIDDGSCDITSCNINELNLQDDSTRVTQKVEGYYFFLAWNSITYDMVIVNQTRPRAESGDYSLSGDYHLTRFDRVHHTHQPIHHSAQFMDSISWSPDGSKIVFREGAENTSARQKLGMIEFDSKAFTVKYLDKIPYWLEPDPPNFIWSPDSRSFFWISRQGFLTQYDLDHGFQKLPVKADRLFAIKENQFLVVRNSCPFWGSCINTLLWINNINKEEKLVLRFYDEASSGFMIPGTSIVLFLTEPRDIMWGQQDTAFVDTKTGEVLGKTKHKIRGVIPSMN